MIQDNIFIIPIVGIVLGGLFYLNGVRNTVYTDKITGSQKHHDPIKNTVTYFLIVRYKNTLRTVECTYGEYLDYYCGRIKKYSYTIKQVK